MTDRKTTPEERRRYILEQRAADEAHVGSGRRVPMDMSFIDRAGNIIRPSREEYYAGKKKQRETSDYETQSRYTPLIIAIVGLFAGSFFLSSSMTGNVITNLTGQTSGIVGVGLFVLGIIGLFFYFKKR